MTHLSADELRAWYAQGRAADRARVIAHLGACETCRKSLSALAVNADPDLATPAITATDVVPFGYAAWNAGRERHTWLWHHPLVRLAGAAAVVLAVVWISTPTVNQTRNQSVRAMPSERPGTAEDFRWESPFQAARYRVTLRDAKDVLMVTGEVSASPFRPEAALRSQLVIGETYSWKVESLDSSGAVIAQSVPATFRYQP